MNLELDVQRASEDADLPTDAEFTTWVEAALAGQHDDVELTIRIVDEMESAALNTQYRHKQGATNVLSFPFECPPEVELNLLGDLVICAPVVEREAREQGKSVRDHWAHMVVHGTLHLLGFDHIDDVDAEEMEALEIDILERMGICNPYREVES